jgi:sulfur carrier protein
MVVIVNGKEVETEARLLSDLIAEQTVGGVKIATALNGHFVPAARRELTPIAAGDRIEIVSPRQGG